MKWIEKFRGHSRLEKDNAPVVHRPQGDLYDLDAPLLMFSPHDPWTTRMACSGTAIFGETGSGKTTGSGAAIARSFLRAGFAGLVCCAKPEERLIWQRLASETGRAEHLVIFGADQPWRFNFLEYERTRQNRGGGQVENLVELLMKAAEFAEGKQSMAGGDGDFFERASREMLRAAISILTLAKEELTIAAIQRLITDAPQSLEEAESAHWQQTSYCGKMLKRGQQNATSARAQHDLRTSTLYWRQWATMADRTRSSILATYSSVANALNQGFAWELFGTTTNLVPEVTYKNGAIIILDLPIQEYFAVGRLCQALFKYLFQRALLQRNAEVDPRPVFLWCDEAQNFISPGFDFQFQAVARSARVCTVLLSQSTSGYYALMQGGGRDEINALLTNLTTKVFHANSDHASNLYAADLIGKRWRSVHNYSTSRSQNGANSSAGGSQQLVYAVEPSELTKLRKGGPQNHLAVDALVYQGGRRWAATDETYMFTTFRQC